MIGENPMDKVKVQRKETKQKQKALDAETRKRAMEAIEGNEAYKPIVYTMIAMGLRIGETIALMWSDVDFKNNTMRVNKAAKATPEINDKGEITGRSMEISGTKTVCSVRTLPIPEVVREALKEWQKVWFQRFKASETDNLVFPNKDGKLGSYSGIRRQFGRFLKEKRLENITFVPPVQAYLRNDDAGAGSQRPGGAGVPGAQGRVDYTWDLHGRNQCVMKAAADRRMRRCVGWV
jgi:integrase